MKEKKCFTIFLVQESVVEIGTAMLISAVQMLKLAVFSQVYVQYIPDIFHLKNASFDNSKFSNDMFKARKGLGWGAQWENDIHGGKGMHVTNICFFTVKRQLLCNFRRYFNLELVTIELRPIPMNNRLVTRITVLILTYLLITYFYMNFKTLRCGIASVCKDSKTLTTKL